MNKPVDPSLASALRTTKGAIDRMSLALRLELAGSGIRVTEICRGLVDTGPVPEELREITGGMKLLTPGDDADAVRYAIEVPPHVDIATLELLPVEQAVGGVAFKPVGDDRFK